ncbi:MAG: prepilin-type N-terminal cleavage/methylation domain-containing protein [Candidatus Omnitrophica bacterium]|nr:prepilin-type N-terminal cleavage/methylation domain-containing protein [Candidatus Omnitrophota bacterium]MBU4457965.1 prepilin-type N-terminal cleavage/methylation domain-containing protein [Candidatus Omnitrophota bacterium]
MNRKAMTLTELLMVVAIIAIISALSMPMMLKSIEKGKVGEASTNLNFIRTAQKHYFLANGTFSSDIDSLPIENPNAQTNRYFYYEASQAGDDLSVDFTARATRGVGGAQPAPGGYGYYYEISKDGDITPEAGCPFTF